ncbi:MAG: type II secretion system protein [Stygiobacter sp. RIFOXYC12_FULL_38_8]|nr:MAG: Type IV pilus assembly protein PilC [Stygiobacter sp.]KAF0215498.1 MAG: Type IV pilus assembly protein [Ignavibacteria bacterium]OGU64685.1 MAG: type II secretion system protein [Stygiobacter sp. GWC2_38_9]OGU84251.1 MAG: type II secretion system protein [Stygiobacter sp. RIFOXYA12_FULL_38_9]OGV05921.1 MAG: type II secretion system protein [Stygiobacter sp. RIFOXYB2_FULL_37_11]OGV10667.1 MAG: type II secretion system protein [Stygiobacter sp. RIFOXYA2_FULL_38_8]OGV14512.1 MAG: type II
MVEVRFTAMKNNGQVISGSLTEPSFSVAKKKIQKLVEKNQLKIQSIEKKVSYLYKIKKGKEKPIVGEQRAYNKEEVSNALRKLGYEVVSINRKLIEFSSKPPHQEIVSFVKISAELLDQKLPYAEILTLLINDIQNKTLKETLKQINNELKKGTDSETAFLRYQSIFGKFTAYMLGLASKSGNMSEIYKATAKFLERQQEFRKNMKSALISPLVTVFILFLAVLFYVGYIFPETAKLFVKFKIELPPMTAYTLKLSDLLMNNLLIVALFMIVPPLVFIRFAKTKKGKLLVDKYMMKLPIMGSLIHKTNIEVFCRVFYTLYSGSAESIEPIRIAAEATGNDYFESRIKNIAIPMMIKRGVGITEAFEASGVFTETAISRFHSGEETGTIKNTALQLANYYESETVFRLKNIIEMIQVFIAMIIMIVMIGLTLVSAETATISPKPPVMN